MKNTLKIGDRVSFVAHGKVFRCEGMAGELVAATVTADTHFDSDGVLCVTVICDHRQLSGAIFYGMQSSVPVSKITVLKEPYFIATQGGTK